MQYHQDGYRPGDPTVSPAVELAVDPQELPDEVDVLIVGCGPAGLLLAAQLARFPTIVTRIVELRTGPLLVGQADGLQCRSLEMLNAFGITDRLLTEAYLANVTMLWRPHPENPTRVHRDGKLEGNDEDFSEFPHVIVNQARVQDYLLEAMRKAPARLQPHYGLRVVGLQIGPGAQEPVEVSLEPAEGPVESSPRTVRARYVVGCDGARSTVRTAMGRHLVGDKADQAWGVMDVLAVTDFPDVRRRNIIQRTDGGNLILIPREGGHLIRLYVELGARDAASLREVTSDSLVAIVQRTLAPYSFEVKEFAWWSVYEVGQRLCDRFDNLAGPDSDEVPRVFIAGDACHTHSAKAGQGMNVSMQDAFNLGWKLASVLVGRSEPGLLRTYSAERQPVADELIEFDRNWAAMIAAPAVMADDTDAPGGVSAADVRGIYERLARYRAGVATLYPLSVICGAGAHQQLASGFPVGMRLHSAPVIRLADGLATQLGHVGVADGAWRLYVFADRPALNDPASRAAALLGFLGDSPRSPLRLFTPAGADADAVIDLRAVIQQEHTALSTDVLPPVLLPRTGKLRLIDYEKAFCADRRSESDIFELRGVDADRGCMVIVRPDQFVAEILPLDATDDLTSFFARVLIPVLDGATRV